MHTRETGKQGLRTLLLHVTFVLSLMLCPQLPDLCLGCGKFLEIDTDGTQ